MRPPFNSFQPQARPQQQQQNNGYHQHQHNGYQNQLGMMMNNPMIPVPNMPIQPHFFFNNMHQQQQQLQQFGLPNQFLPNLNLMAQPNFYRPPPLGPCAFSSLNPLSYPNHHQNQQLPRPQSAGNGNDFRNNFTKHQKGSQLHGSNKKSGFNKEHKRKRNYNKMSSSHDGSGVDSIAKEKKRPYVCFYTPKEIQLWREARRRNFPTKHNILKKSKKNLKEEAKLRRQQLQEVVAKQAELGVEVAQVPSHYLSRTQEQANGDNNGQALNDKDGRRGRSQNNKTRHGENDKFNKKPKSEDQNSSQESSSITMREPTLVEKLLSADMKRDKSRLLQVLRFMVINSFFKDQLPLKLPLVMVEDEDEVDVDMNGDDNSAVERSFMFKFDS